MMVCSLNLQARFAVRHGSLKEKNNEGALSKIAKKGKRKNEL